MKTCQQCKNDFEPPKYKLGQRLCDECLRRNHVKSVNKNRAKYKARLKKPKAHVFTPFDGDDGEIQNFVRFIADIPPTCQERSAGYLRRAHPEIYWLFQ